MLHESNIQLNTGRKGNFFFFNNKHYKCELIAGKRPEDLSLEVDL